MGKMGTRITQKKANNFIKSLENKSEKQIKQLYLDTKEFQNNEIVLSHIFFKYPSLIRILPLDFQVSRINSNLNMFEYGSEEAKKNLASLWIKDNKLFMNLGSIGVSPMEVNEYVKLYFKQPEDVAKLFMNDLEDVIKKLISFDVKETEDVIKKIKNDLTDRQWDFILEAYPAFIKYTPETIQDKYSTNEKYINYINGSARKNYINSELDKLKSDPSLFNSMSFEIQSEYIKLCPSMINTLDDSSLIELLKYNNDLLKYVNFNMLKNDNDNSQELLYGILENIDAKDIKEIVDLFVNKGIFNAKGKLYRYNIKSNDISYQYTKRSILAIQKLTLNQIIALIMVDVNFVLPYIVPVYSNDEEVDIKEKIILDANSRCLNLFKAYYSKEIYDQYYKVVNKIYNEYLTNIDKYDYESDYDCVFDLFKLLFNKNVIQKNKFEKLSVLVGITLLYKDTDKNNNSTSIKLLNDVLSVAYDKEINNDESIYDLNCLEIYDDRLSFINKDLLYSFSKKKFSNISCLLFIVKAKKVVDYFKKYYNILINIYGENEDTLFKAIENFQYYLPILRNIDGKELTSSEQKNLISLLSSYGNYSDIKKVEQLDNYEITLLKDLSTELSIIKDEDVYKNIVCKYLFNIPYDSKGITGFLETDTIKELMCVFDSDILNDFRIDDKKVFAKEECDLFSMINLLFSSGSDVLFEYVENFVSNKIERNILSVVDFFSKIKKYRLELINSCIVSIKDIDDYCEQRPDLIFKEYRKGICVYTINNQDFKLLFSLGNDRSNLVCENVSKINRNCYGYDRLIKDDIRFSMDEDKCLIKYENFSNVKSKLRPTFIVANGRITDQLIDIAQRGNLPIIEIGEE